MPSEGLQKMFNQALVNSDFQEKLFESLEKLLEEYKVPQEERSVLLQTRPRNIGEFAKVISSFTG